jgi:hypothetical protein
VSDPTVVATDAVEVVPGSSVAGGAALLVVVVVVAAVMVVVVRGDSGSVVVDDGAGVGALGALVVDVVDDGLGSVNGVTEVDVVVVEVGRAVVVVERPPRPLPCPGLPSLALTFLVPPWSAAAGTATSRVRSTATHAAARCFIPLCALMSGIVAFRLCGRLRPT